MGLALLIEGTLSKPGGNNPLHQQSMRLPTAQAGDSLSTGNSTTTPKDCRSHRTLAWYITASEITGAVSLLATKKRCRLGNRGMYAGIVN